MRTLSIRRLQVAAIVAVMTLAIVAAFTRSSAQEANTIRLVAGDTLEIGTDTASPQSQFSWILTKDRTFLGAQRTRFFQTRIAEPGMYVLDVSIQDPVTSVNGYRAFTIIVSEPVPGSAPVIPLRGDTAKPLRAALSTEPSAIGGGIYLPPEGGIVRIDASGSEGTISTYKLDLDLSVDSNGDGDTTNDFDNESTLSEKSGSPIYVFMLPKETPRVLRLTVSDLATVAPSTVELPVQFAAAPLMPSSAGVGGLVSIERDGLRVTFHANLDPSVTAGKEVLYEWDFGDRAKSLLTSPVHTYARAGTYTVGLTVRDIATAEILHSGIDTLVIDPSEIPASSAASSVASSSSSAASSGSGVSASGIVTVSVIILLLLGLALGLYALFTWIKNKTTTSLQKTLEKMEDTIVKKPETTVTTEPMKLKKAFPPVAVTDAETAKTEFKTQARANVTPVASSGPVPSWLSNAGKSPAPAPKPAPAPAKVPAPAPKPSPTTPVPKPAPAPKPAPPKAEPKITPSVAAAPVTSPPVPKAERPAAAPAAVTEVAKTTPVTAPTHAPVKPAEPVTPAKESPKPAPAPTPAPEIKPQAPVSMPIQKAESKKPDDGEPPIAIIQADSLSK